MKTLTLLEWQLIHPQNKGFVGEGLQTTLIRDDGARMAVVVYDGEKRTSWLERDPLPSQCEWQPAR